MIILLSEENKDWIWFWTGRKLHGSKIFLDYFQQFYGGRWSEIALYCQAANFNIAHSQQKVLSDILSGSLYLKYKYKEWGSDCTLVSWKAFTVRWQLSRILMLTWRFTWTPPTSFLTFPTSLPLSSLSPVFHLLWLSWEGIQRPNTHTHTHLLIKFATLENSMTLILFVYFELWINVYAFNIN